MKKFLSILSAISLAAALTVSSSAALLGDVNSDGQINSADALGVLQYSVGISVKNFNKANADVNKDGRINSSDALKILRISVGLESADDTSTVKSEIVKTYNASLAKTYQQVKTATVTQYETGTYTFNGKSEEIKTGPNTTTGKFKNGVDENGNPAWVYGPDTKLTENMLSSATVTKLSSGMKIRLVLKSEKVDVKKDPVSNAAGGFPFEFGLDGTGIKDYTSGSVTYSGTVIEAVTDANGRVKELNIKTPYSSEFTMKQKNGKVDKITEKGETSYYGTFSF